MKLYQMHKAPNPRRVRMFMAEKSITAELVELDLQKGENLTQEMRAKNPLGKVPVLELDDGTCISECTAIYTYLESQFPEPPLMGTTAVENAQVVMWEHQVELALMLQIGMCFQHTTGYFRDRMTPIPEYGHEAGKIAQQYMKLLDRRLGEFQFIAGDFFSAADITALCAIDFGRVVDIRIAEEHSNLARWHAEVSKRESAKA
ncbi:glutathione S-transferase family protein [Alteromonas sp. ASW11-130]|uniref:glutathione S-transferase family protein n=1 Tax=Alteromonas sp. ASW11-130 TaxID=3015775 RepID=UPI002242C23C|nr:glutathione S-transferase family protein [Alteromonas sp. ASW11-130]MCW8090762.1 glutathione S-transferase family protein [Alteromonas sp. ASW11-130]